MRYRLDSCYGHVDENLQQNLDRVLIPKNTDSKNREATTYSIED